MKRLAIITSTGIVGAAGGSFYLWKINKDAKNSSDASNPVNPIQLAQAGFRIFRLLNTTISIVIDYKYTIWKHSLSNKESSRYEIAKSDLRFLQEKEVKLTEELWKAKDAITEATKKSEIAMNKRKIEALAEEISDLTPTSHLSRTHTRSAKKLLHMCVKNKGVYIKLGQHIAMQDFVVPNEYQTILLSLLSKNPVSDWSSVSSVMKSSLGASPEELFLSIEKVPLASASLAQVHEAIGHDGKKYAVKVQHEDLLYGTHGDLMAISFAVNCISTLFKDFNYNWLVREINRNVPEELDFLNEAKNIKKCTKLFKQKIEAGDIAIPTVIDNLTSNRVLTMTFEDGCYATDLDKIKAMGLKNTDIAHNISSIFCDQIYRFGYVHCDPHPHNVLVRKHPYRHKYPQIVLLDHGLYRTLSPEFKHDYTRLWCGIVLSDAEMIKKYATCLNAGSLFTLLAAILTMKPWDDVISEDNLNRLKRKNTKGEKQLLKSYALKYIREILMMLSIVPSDLLLVFKTNDCLRHLDMKLGSPVNTTVIIAETVASMRFYEDLGEVWKSNSNDETISNTSELSIIDKWFKTLKIISSFFQIMSRVFSLRIIKHISELNSYLSNYFENLYTFYLYNMKLSSHS